jgi:nucleoside-diphosphate-sugar epimerase
MKVLVTGASGFIGRSLLPLLAAQGGEVVTLGRTPAPGPAHIQADLLTTPDLPRLLHGVGATHLLHLAWYVEHGLYWESPQNLRWQEASVRLVEAFCDAGGCHAVLAGTCAEYDWSAPAPFREVGSPAEPATLYGIAKDATRRLTMAVCARRQVGCAWARIFLPYGAGEAAARLVPSLASVFRGERAAFGVNAAGRRDFLHAADVAGALAHLALTGGNGIFNIGSGQPVPVADLVRTLAGLMGADPEPVLALATERPGEPALLAGDVTRLFATGWRPALSLRDGLARMLEEGR